MGRPIGIKREVGSPVLANPAVFWQRPALVPIRVLHVHALHSFRWYPVKHGTSSKNRGLVESLDCSELHEAGDTAELLCEKRCQCQRADTSLSYVSLMPAAGKGNRRPSRA
jgi:hypothetical protein